MLIYEISDKDGLNHYLSPFFLFQSMLSGIFSQTWYNKDVRREKLK